MASLYQVPRWAESRRAAFSQATIFYMLTLFFLVFFGVFTFVLYPMKDSLHPNALCDWLLEVLPSSFLGPVAMVRCLANDDPYISLFLSFFFSFSFSPVYFYDYMYEK